MKKINSDSFKERVLAKSENDTDIMEMVDVMKRLSYVSYAARTYNCHKKYEQSLRFHIA